MGSLESRQTEQELREETRKIRRLQLMMNLVMSTISQTELSLEEASQMVADAKTAALTMFPDKELAYDLIYKPRLQRLMRERFHLQ
jgi:DNA helicase IV